MKKVIKILGIVIVFSVIMWILTNLQEIKEVSGGYEIRKNADLNVILKTPLNSNKNERGDLFVTTLKKPLLYNNKVLLPKDTEIKGLVKSVIKYKKSGDRSGILLLFDQIVLPDGSRMPIVASLNTNEGEKVIKIKGKIVKETSVVTRSALIGILLGSKTSSVGADRGMIVGTGLGAGAVILSNKKEINLPEGTELVIKLDEPILIAK